MKMKRVALIVSIMGIMIFFFIVLNFRGYTVRQSFDRYHGTTVQLVRHGWPKTGLFIVNIPKDVTETEKPALFYQGYRKMDRWILMHNGLYFIFFLTVILLVSLLILRSRNRSINKELKATRNIENGVGTH